MNKKAFTLVELIVVITILAVLATVAFISFQGYAVTSRDSVRISDIANMQKVLELYNVKNSKYPIPDNGIDITYSGSIAWTQGVFGTSAYTDSSSMSNIPVDPVTGLEYPYSRTVNGKEYEIAAVLEQPVLSNLTQPTFAGTQEVEIYVKGNYNGKFLKVRKNTTTYLLGVPSILASDITSVDLETIITNKKLVYNGYKNLPASFSGSIYDANPTKGFDFTPAKIILFEGNIQDLENNQTDRIAFLNNLQANYTGSIIKAETGISEIVNIVDTTSVKSTNYISTTLNNVIKTTIPIREIIATASSESISSSNINGVTGTGNNTIYSIKNDAVGNIYVFGTFYGNSNIFGNDYTGNNVNQLYISKLSSNLQLQWTRVSTSSNDLGGSQSNPIDIDVNGNIYITGKFSGLSNIFGQDLQSAGGYDIFVSKISTNGALQWSVKSGGVNDDDGIAIAVNNNEIFVTGSFRGESTIFGTLLTVNAVSARNIFLAKLDNNGLGLKVVNSTSNLNTGSDVGTTLDIDSNGYVYIGGDFSQTVSLFGELPIYAGSSGVYESFFAKFDNNLNLQWLTNAQGNGYVTGSSIIVNNGSIYMTGRSNGNSLFGKTVTHAGSHDVFIAKLNTIDGSNLWVQKYGSESWDGGFAITLDANEDILVTGKFTGTLNTEGQNLTSDSSDIFLLKVSNGGNFIWEKSMGGAGGDIGQGILIINSSLYLAGWVSSSVNILGSNVNYIGGVDGFIVKSNY